MTVGPALIVAVVAVAGWEDRPPLVVKGGDPSTGILVNVTPGARPSDGADPARPTVVFVHGLNPLPRTVHFHMAEEFAASLARRGGPPLNVFGWNWNAATFTSLRSKENSAAAVEQGRILAATLRGSGVDLSQTQLIGHSAGGIVAASAARSLAFEHGTPIAQLTLLDPAAYYHSVIFQELAAGATAPIVENYWASGLSGYGRPVASAGVRSIQVDGPMPALGLVWLTRSNHLFVVHWYLDSAANPAFPSGFNASILLVQRPSPAGRRNATVAGRAAPAGAMPAGARAVNGRGATSPVRTASTHPDGVRTGVRASQ